MSQADRVGKKYSAAALIRNNHALISLHGRQGFRDLISSAAAQF